MPETANATVLDSSSAGEKPTTVRYRVMGFLCALSFLTYFDRVCIVRAQGDIQRDLQLSDTQMGWVMGAFWLAYGLFEIPGGWMGDRFGPRRTLVRIVLGWSLFTVLSGSAWSFLSLLAFRFLFGVGEAGAYPNMAAVQSRWVPTSQRARLGGLLWLFARWGGAFSPILIGMLLRTVDSPGFREFLSDKPLLSHLYDLSSWRFGFWIAGALGALWCVLFYPWFRNEPAQSKETNAAERALLPPPRDANSHGANKDVWRALLSCPSLWAMAALYFCGSFGWSFFVSWMPRFLKDTQGVTFEKSEFISALPLFLGGCSCLLGGLLCDWLVNRTGRKRLIRALFPIVGCVTAACAMFGLRYVENAQQAAVLMCIAAGMYDMGQSSNWATIVDIGGQHAGIATGFINMLGNMGHFVQPIFGAYVFTHHGWNAMLVCYGIAFLVAGSMWLVIDPTKTFSEYAAARAAQPEPVSTVSGIGGPRTQA